MTRSLVALLAALTLTWVLAGCATSGAQAPREVISQAPVCARRLQDGRVVEGPEVCASTASSGTATPVR